MSKVTKTLDHILRGSSDANINFKDLCKLLTHLGFVEHTRGSHHIFSRDGVEVILNLQPLGNKAKAYQVKQVRAVIVAYDLASEMEGESTEEEAESDGSHKQRRKKEPGDDLRYEVILYWSKEDQAFIAEVPELAGCAADGATYQEAMANVEVVMREWIETARELGRSIPEPRGRLLFA